MNAASATLLPTLRPAVADDLPAIVALLAGCGLPTGDFAGRLPGSFLVAQAGTTLVGTIGLETLGDIALLRSLAVLPQWRGQAIATRLVAHWEEAARATGIAALYLLTTTAADYFLRRGYAYVARDAVPPQVAGHAQFRSLCPASAKCLRLSLISAHTQAAKGKTMTTLEIYDPALCCPTGVCGVDVDPVLVQFAADLKWVAEQGVDVKRYNLAQQPQDFAANAAVVKAMEAGIECLPIVAVDGQIVATGTYLTRAQLTHKLKLALPSQDKPHISLKVGSGCCNPKSGCC